MIAENTYIAAFLLGLLGGVHCVGMCGGIVAALSLNIKRSTLDAGLSAVLPLQIGYNLGRLSSYVLIGLLAGSFGWLLSQYLPDVRQAQQVLQLISIAFMLMLGLYLAGWWQGAAYLERVGAPIWRRIEPLGRRLMPVQHFLQAYVFGAIWGWLPCGLVYTILIWALLSVDPVHGALLMLSFGVGTLPNLLLMGSLASQLSALTRKVWVRRSAGLLVIGLALFSLWLMWNGGDVDTLPLG